MSDDNQILIPTSFMNLFIEPGRIKPSETREVIAQRYDLCEDMAQMLVEPCRESLWDLGITESDVLQRTDQGLAASETDLSGPETQWVVRRLAELLGWEWLQG
jgi:hypothetical protein